MGDETYPDPPHGAPSVPMQPPPEFVVDHPADEKWQAAEELDARADGPRPSAWRLLISSGSGRAGLALFAVMLLVSMWVLIAYPANFGSALWSNPAYWANNPRNVPPVWASRLTGQPAFPQTLVRDRGTVGSHHDPGGRNQTLPGPRPDRERLDANVVDPDLERGDVPRPRPGHPR